MPERYTIRFTILVLLFTTMLGGCKPYWGKPAATAEQFNRDSTECAKEASPAQLASYGIGSEKVYKACMTAHGWRREKRPVSDPGDGWFRGVERDFR